MSSQKWSTAFRKLMASNVETFDGNLKAFEEENNAFREMMLLFDASVDKSPFLQEETPAAVASWVADRIKRMLLADEAMVRHHYSQTLKSNRALAFGLKKQTERLNLFAGMSEKDFLMGVALGIGGSVVDADTRRTAQKTQLDLDRPHKTSVGSLLRDEAELLRQNEIIDQVDDVDKEIVLLCLRSGQFPSEVSSLVGASKTQVNATISKYEDVKGLLMSSN